MIGWLAWHAIAAASVAGGAALATARLDDPKSLLTAAFFGAAYLALALAVSVCTTRFSRAVIWALASGAVLGGGLALLVRKGLVPDTPLTFAMAVACAVAPLVPHLVGRPRAGLALALPLAALGAGFLSREAPDSDTPSVVRSALYPLALDSVPLPGPLPTADGGALAALPGGLLLAQGDGRFRWISGEGPLRSRTIRMTAIPDPMDRAAYLADFPGTDKPPRLRLTGALFGPGDRPARLYTAHQTWHGAETCYTQSLSAIDLAWTAEGPEPAGPWQTLYDSTPCQKAEGEFDDSETGGRLAWLDDTHILMSFGDLGFAGLDDTKPYSQEQEGNSYGKVLEIDAATGAAEIFTLGHRNPQGLTVARDGRIWLSEHGPQGGDEVNRLRKGANYGWPYATYGTQYGATAWPLNADPHDHGSYTEPALAFVPSVATSALVEAAGPEFPAWEHDLLLGTLRTQSIYRLRLRGDRVLYAEPIHVGERVRDLAVLADGRVVAWADRGVLVEVTVSPDDSAFDRYCTSCHAPRFGVAPGPQLTNVLGREVASVPGYAYSEALLALGGTWTPDRLRAFVTDPGRVAPGTAMIDPDIPDDQIDALLKELGG